LGASRAGRIKEADIRACIDSLEQLPIHVDESLAALGFNCILMLGQSEVLTTYDASYLEIALRKDIPIATNNKKLIAAAQRLNVPLI
jgi:predicted nucleic acid-binding protein